MTRKNTIGQIYAYVVCFALTMGLVIMTFAGLSGLFKIILPDYTMNKHDYTNYQRLIRQEASVDSESDSRSDISESAVAVQDSAAGDIRTRSAIGLDQVTSSARVTSAETLEAHRRQGVSALIEMAIALLICLPLFWVHFQWAKKLARQEADSRVMKRRYPTNRQPRRYNPRSNSKSSSKSSPKSS